MKKEIKKLRNLEIKGKIIRKTTKPQAKRLQATNN